MPFGGLHERWLGRGFVLPRKGHRHVKTPISSFVKKLCAFVLSVVVVVVNSSIYIGIVVVVVVVVAVVVGAVKLLAPFTFPLRR